MSPPVHASKPLIATAWILDTECGYRATRHRHESEDGALTVSTEDRETGSIFVPKFDDRGLLTAVVTDSTTGSVLMVAHMDQEALDHTRETGLAHFHSRSRGRLWQKGETSGNVLRVESILVDCDQDALVIVARPAGPACHTGAVSCFYRLLEDGGLAHVKT